MTMFEADATRKEVFEKFGYDEYLPCWTVEPEKRPVPFVSTDPRPKKVAELFEMYISVVLSELVPQMTPHVQTYNKIARVGWPINANPVNEAGELIKMQVLLPIFEALKNGDDSQFQGSCNTMGNRQQNEPPSKIREMQFINDEGMVYSEEFDRRKYQVWIEALGRFAVPTRSRPVTCPCAINLYNQVWDTMLHRAIMKHPLCYANVYTHETYTDTESFSSFDCKHFERDLGMLVQPYASAIGGKYGRWLMKMVNDPFLVPSDSWKSAFMIWPQYREGVYPQFGSGLCCVSTLGKLGNICVQMHYFVERYSMTPKDALRVTLSGEHDGVRRWMYGDDNRLRGAKDKRDEFIAHMSNYFHVEVDETPTWLGTELIPSLGQFRLRKDTYVVKGYQPERDFTFKTYPALGLVKRRQTFVEYGHPSIPVDIIPFENQAWERNGLPWSDVLNTSFAEQQSAKANGETISALEATDKEYLLTPEEQLHSGRFWGLPEADTTIIVKDLVDASISKQFKF